MAPKAVFFFMGHSFVQSTKNENRLVFQQITENRFTQKICKFAKNKSSVCVGWGVLYNTHNSENGRHTKRDFFSSLFIDYFVSFFQMRNPTCEDDLSKSLEFHLHARPANVACRLQCEMKCKFVCFFFAPNDFVISMPRSLFFFLILSTKCIQRDETVSF